VRQLPIAVRLATHLVAAGFAVLLVLGPDARAVWMLTAIITIAWMTNLYNFMDGADGLAGGMSLFGFSCYAFAAWEAGHVAFACANLAIAASSAAFLIFNFHPARIFLGDVGSIPLGFLAGALGLAGWANGSWPASFPLLVFSPFIVDASATLARRMLAGERFWEPHREHYYQRLVRLGWGHRQTALVEYALMAAAGALGWFARDLDAAGQAAVIVSMLVFYAGLIAAVEVRWRQAGLQGSP
jgi:UDP-N-acetylmuramyl pentapeptide phosphotransferase/UDP-N-acetylglucosamine-1-phosphate transferase